MMPVSQLQVTVGEHDLQASELPSAVTSGVKNMIIHPGFECGKFVSDIALLELMDVISWTRSVQPACLPPESGSQGNSIFGGKSAVAAGWGWLGEDKATCEFLPLRCTCALNKKIYRTRIKSVLSNYLNWKPKFSFSK